MNLNIFTIQHKYSFLNFGDYMSFFYLFAIKNWMYFLYESIYLVLKC